MSDRPAGHPSYWERRGTADCRRWRVPGGTYFFTINLLERRAGPLVRYIDALRDAVRRTRRERPCYSDGWVVLPEPIHCIITLPEGDDDPRAGRGIYPIPNVFRFRRTA